MSEQQSQPDRPTTSDTKPEGPDKRAPTPNRRAELRAAYEANLADGKPPYDDVEIRTDGELMWVRSQQGWWGVDGASQANLSGAKFDFANLSGVSLANTNLTVAGFHNADLSAVRFSPVPI
jgi:uncharacterized protein YjbI with pentapeptide repeats